MIDPDQLFEVDRVVQGCALGARVLAKPTKTRSHCTPRSTSEEPRYRSKSHDTPGERNANANALILSIAFSRLRFLRVVKIPLSGHDPILSKVIRQFHSAKDSRPGSPPAVVAGGCRIGHDHRPAAGSARPAILCDDVAEAGATLRVDRGWPWATWVAQFGYMTTSRLISDTNCPAS